MIRVHEAVRDDQIILLEVTGHAESAESGKDLVCSAVSAVMFGLCNALDEMKTGCAITVDENCIRIETVRNSAKMQTILNTGIIQLRTIQETNRKYIRITRTEEQ